MAKIPAWKRRLYYATFWVLGKVLPTPVLIRLLRRIK